MTGSIEIFGRRNSSNVAPVMWAVGELGLDHVRHNVGGSFGGLDEQYAKLNPNRLVPVVRDGDVVLWESSAIVRYLAATYGEGSLWPEDTAMRGIADQWMEWCKTTLNPTFFPIFWQLIRTPAEDCDREQVERSVAATARTLGILEQHLGTTPYIGGNRLTMGDLPFGSLIYRYFNLDIPRPALPNIESWYGRLCERSAYQTHIMIPFGRNKNEWDALERQGVD